MKNKIVHWTIGSVLLVVLALVLGTCQAIADTSALIQTPDTVWISLTPTKAVEVSGVRTATLTLDFSKALDGQVETLGAEGLNKLFTFWYHDSTESGIAVTGVKKTVVGIYTLAVSQVPNDDEGIVLVTINKPSISPATRVWALNGEVVSNADLTAKLLDFRFKQSDNTALSEDAVGGIDHEAGTVVVVLPMEASLNSLVPTITTNPGNTFVPEAQTDWTNDVVYTISTAKSIAETNKKTYTVSVSQQTPESASIKFFGFTKEENSAAGLGDSVSGVINEGDKTISVTVPDGTNVSALKPNIVHSGAGISPANLASHDFTNPVSYTVTPVSGAPIVYVVTVTVDTAASDTRVELIAGPLVSVFADDTTADASFTNVSGLTLSAADFAVTTGATIDSVTVDGDTATVALSFAENFSMSAQPYTVSVAVVSMVIKGSAAVAITHEALYYTIADPTSPDLLIKFGIK